MRAHQIGELVTWQQQPRGIYPDLSYSLFDLEAVLNFM